MKVKDRLASLAGFHGGRGTSAPIVDEVQKELALTFAPDYRAYLIAYGTMICEGHELTGISKSRRLNVVTATQRARELEPQVPKALYLIEDATIDGILIWQDAKGIVYQTTPGGEPRRIADSLIGYLETDDPDTT